MYHFEERVPTYVLQVGMEVAESSQTESDAEDDVLTFEENLIAVEVFHSEETPQDFVVNGLTVTVASGGWRSLIGGNPAKTVGLPSGVTGIIVTPLR